MSQENLQKLNASGLNWKLSPAFDGDDGKQYYTFKFANSADAKALEKKLDGALKLSAEGDAEATIPQMRLFVRDYPTETKVMDAGKPNQKTIFPADILIEERVIDEVPQFLKALTDPDFVNRIKGNVSAAKAK